MIERTYGDIDWELDDVIDWDIDGAGTRMVSLTGYARCDEGGGHFEFEATASQTYPYDGEYEEIEIDDDATEFIPDEREPEDV